MVVRPQLAVERASPANNASIRINSYCERISAVHGQQIAVRWAAALAKQAARVCRTSCDANAAHCVCVDSDLIGTCEPRHFAFGEP